MQSASAPTSSTTRRTHSKSAVVPRNPTSPVAQRVRWSVLRWPMEDMNGGSEKQEGGKTGRFFARNLIPSRLPVFLLSAAVLLDACVGEMPTVSKRIERYRIVYVNCSPVTLTRSVSAPRLPGVEGREDANQGLPHAARRATSLGPPAAICGDARARSIEGCGTEMTEARRADEMAFDRLRDAVKTNVD